MVSPEVYPPEAQAAGCTATYSVFDTTHQSDSLYTYGQTWYRLSATEVLGWRFGHFEWTQTISTGTSKSGDSYSNPTTSRIGTLADYSISWNQEYIALPDESGEVTYCRAVFIEDPHGDITVTTEADPVAGGTTSPVSETHQYAGNSSTTFTLTATPNAGYVFEKWMHGNAVQSIRAQTTVTLYFGASA